MKYSDVVVGMKVSPKCCDYDEMVPVLMVKDAKSDGTFTCMDNIWHDLNSYYSVDSEPFREGDTVVCIRNHGLCLKGITLVVKSIRQGCFWNVGGALDGKYSLCHDADYFERLSV